MPPAEQKPAPAKKATPLKSPPAATRYDLATWWWIPTPGESIAHPPAVAKAFASGVDLYANGRFADALPLVGNPALDNGPLAAYALYYTGLTRQALGRVEDARAAFDVLRARRPRGALASLVVARAAEAASAASDHVAAATLYNEALAAGGGEAPVLLLGLARSAVAAGDPQTALEALARLYSEFPTTEQAGAAETELSQTPVWQEVSSGSWRSRTERARADRLFAARRYAEALAAFDLVAPHTSGADKDLVRLRLAECDYHLRRFRAARDAVTPLTERGALKAEALFYLANALRELKAIDQYVAVTRRLADEHGSSSWAEDGLNLLATYFVVDDQDAKAAAVFREMYSRWPRGRHAERAAWKAGWWAYRQGEWNGAIRIFEDAAVGFPRSDYRPSWRYWAARARQRAGDRQGASVAFRAVVSDYRNTFYGRRAVKSAGPPLKPLGAPVSASVTSAPEGLPENHGLIRLLISLELFDLAQQELAEAERSWGRTPALLATQAWVAQALGEPRRGIILMKRAYPAYLSAAPGQLPRPLLDVIYPLEYWATIKRYAAAHKLDPYLVAGLINQESTYDAGIRSSAGAIGLMQVMPATGRRYARRLGIRRFSAASLTRPEVNIRIGTAYLADLFGQFKRPHLALAAYNGGDSRVLAWMSERRGLADDEFIDDIPFPETQGYVRKVLGMAEDYRELHDLK